MMGRSEIWSSYQADTPMSTMAELAFQAAGAGSIPSPAPPSSLDRHPDFWPVRRSIQLVSIAA
jgi:hypothetical protein